MPIFGYPLTDEFVDPATGRVTQWFERARFEWHPGTWPERYDVLLGRLGSELTRGRETEEPFLPAQPGQVEALTGDGAYQPVSELRLGHTVYLTWDEGIEQRREYAGQLSDLLSQPATLAFALPASEGVGYLAFPTGEIVGRVVRCREEFAGQLSLWAEPLADCTFCLRRQAENHTAWPSGIRCSQAIPFVFVGLHVLLGTVGGASFQHMRPRAAQKTSRHLRRKGSGRCWLLNRVSEVFSWLLPLSYVSQPHLTKALG